jgi:hypothetical protein
MRQRQWEKEFRLREEEMEQAEDAAMVSGVTEVWFGVCSCGNWNYCSRCNWSR